MHWIYALIALATFASFVIMARFYFTNARRMTSHTTGQVVSSEERVRIENDRRHVDTHIVVRYSAHGRELTLARVVRGGFARKYPPGLELNIKYNPAEPEMADLA